LELREKFTDANIGLENILKNFI